ncbi:MAG: helix-turn-helix domain-containing protein [Flammeovirgaceae bacterium]|nr:helix-turn-helix domain-containing protein [Flammeovirgaceae bacterium]
MMNVKPIRNNSDLEEALHRINQLLDAKEGSPEFDELEVISVLVEDFETRNYEIPEVSPQRILKFLMKQNDLTQKDLIPYIGSKTGVSEVINGKRSISLKAASKLSKKFNVSIDIFIDESVFA